MEGVITRAYNTDNEYRRIGTSYTDRRITEWVRLLSQPRIKAYTSNSCSQSKPPTESEYA